MPFVLQVPARSRASVGKRVAVDEDTAVRPLAPPEVDASSTMEDGDSVGALRDEQGVRGDGLLQAVVNLTNEVQVNFVV